MPADEIGGPCLMPEAILFALSVFVSLVLCLAILTAAGHLGIWAQAISGSWRVQLFRLGWYPLALVAMGALALTLHVAARLTVGQLVAASFERYRRFRRSRRFRPYVLSIENPEYRRVIGEIYRLADAAGLHQVLDAITYPMHCSYLEFVAGRDPLSSAFSASERLGQPPLSVPGGGSVGFMFDELLHPLLATGVLAFGEGMWNVDPQFLAVLKSATSAHPILPGVWLPGPGASRAAGVQSPVVDTRVDPATRSVTDPSASR